MKYGENMHIEVIFIVQSTCLKCSPQISDRWQTHFQASSHTRICLHGQMSNKDSRLSNQRIASIVAFSHAGLSCTRLKNTSSIDRSLHI